MKSIIRVHFILFLFALQIAEAPLVVGFCDADTIPLEFNNVSEQEKLSMRSYVEENLLPAVAYVTSQFDKHDVVLLGETHQIADNCRFVASTIEPLYRKGVRTLAWEFTRSSLNSEIDRLITASEFDDELANSLLRRGPWPTWGYQEYVDILRSAWQLNKSLPDGAKPFRVIALDSDWSQFGLWFGGMNQLEVFETIADREKHMTKVLKAETLEKNEKAVVHIGYAHTLTRHGSRLGKVLNDEYGKRIKQVVLHHSWGRPDGTSPLGDFLDKLLRDPAREMQIGFDIVESPLGRLSDSSAGIFRFAARGATLAEVSQGYVYLGPLKEQQNISWIPGFITDENFQHALAIASRMNWIEKDAIKTPAELDAAMSQRFDGQKRAK